MIKIESLVFLGSGNVAWHLSHAFKKSGIHINQIYSRNEEHAQELADSLGSAFTSRVNDLKNADAYIFALSDSAIEPVLTMRDWDDKLLIHVAGSVEMNVFQNYSNRFGVLYPLQSFTKEKSLDISKIPFLIEGNTKDVQESIIELSGLLSSSQMPVDSETRAKIHLAAVFASNFVNYMLSMSQQLLQKENLELKILEPLINETIQKALELGPVDAQTGPARRNNMNVLKKHELMLESNPDWQKLYTFVAEKITTFYQQHDGKFQGRTGKY